ncbi:TetR/AcrR family transcriptional regulator [Streptosporangium sp. NPDC049644]|uniref:TetR/AcrR family transcriptional regulator n=1 Tax=Streptosporangium sp. NPDC049644 TaxID=3155507 RepID=UPI003435E365
MASPDRATAVRAPRLPAAERRAQLALAAAVRFHQLGYHHVSLADIAEEVGVTGPAVYRHFRNKKALLAGAISNGLDLVEDALSRSDGESLAELVSSIADIGIDRPDLWILLQREFRFLDLESGAKVRKQFSRVVKGLTERLRRERPALSPEAARLLMAAATAVLSSPSVSRTTLPRAVYKRELTRAALAVLRLRVEEVPAGGAPAARSRSKSFESLDSRRTKVVDKAIDLFFHQGYSAVTLDDIGAEVGMTGPSLYYYFPTKADILIAAFERATTRLAADQERRAKSETDSSLDELISSYTAFCLQNHALAGIYVFEFINLPFSARQQTTTVLREGVQEWTTALQKLDGRLYEAVAKVRVNAALAAAHELVRHEELHARPRLAQEIDTIAHAILLQG